jgi:very-short-patch-repair endonuclease
MLGRVSMPEPPKGGKHEFHAVESDASHVDRAGRGKHAFRRSGLNLTQVLTLVTALAARQRGVVTRRQLLARGVGARTIDRAISAGILHPIYRGVYGVLPVDALVPLAREQATVLAYSPDVFLSHDTAAALWGLRPVAADVVHITVVGRNAGPPRPGLVIHHSAELDRRDTRRHEGLPLTAPARTLLDLAPSLSQRQFEQLFDEALVTRRMRRSEVRAMLERHPRRPGVARLAELAHEDRATAWTRADTEQRLLALLRKAHLPIPEVNTQFGRFELDFFWREARLAVETDGYAFHSSRRQLERDHQRDLELQAAGVMIVRFSWRQVRNEPELVVAQIAALLAQRRAAYS